MPGVFNNCNRSWETSSTYVFESRMLHYIGMVVLLIFWILFFGAHRKKIVSWKEWGSKLDFLAKFLPGYLQSYSLIPPSTFDKCRFSLCFLPYTFTKFYWTPLKYSLCSSPEVIHLKARGKLCLTSREPGLYQKIISLVLNTTLKWARCSSNSIKTKSRREMWNFKVKA